MYETKAQSPLSHASFLGRLLRHMFAAATLLMLSLTLGMWGYVHFEHLSPMDAFLNAAMLLGGMGPVNPPCTTAGKLFAGLFALYAGLVFVLAAALILTPIAHRMLHHFHWDDRL